MCLSRCKRPKWYTAELGGGRLVKRRETLPNLKAADAKAGKILAAKNATIADVFGACGAY
jgi:hypothetical protein